MSKKTIVIAVITAVILIFIAVPTAIIGSIIVGCREDTKNQINTAQQIKNALINSSNEIKNVTSEPSGDCVTGTRVGYNFIVDKKFLNLPDARKNVFEYLQHSQINVLPNGTANFTSTKSSPLDTLGGAYAVNQIEEVFYTNGNSGDIRIIYSLEEPIPCYSSLTNCNDSLAKELWYSSRIYKTEVSGLITPQKK